MNVLFFALFFLSAVLTAAFAPEDFLKTLLGGAGSAASLCVALLSSYAVWLGLMKVWEKSGVTRGVSKLLRPAVKRVFLLERDDTAQAVCMNVSANLLGIGGAATPYGIEAARLMQTEKNGGYASAMLFAVNSTSIQLLPTSVIALRTSLKSAAPYDILVPTLICSEAALALNMFFTFVFYRLLPEVRLKKVRKIRATGGAGMRS